MSERLVAGLLCSEVLAALPDFLEDEIASADRKQIEEHLVGCDWCARFGGEYADAVNALRTILAQAPPVPESLRKRLRENLTGE